MSTEMNAMPKLGFGLMRLPEKDGVIDHDHVCRMVDRYMKAEMNYFDTAYISWRKVRDGSKRSTGQALSARQFHDSHQASCMGD